MLVLHTITTVGALAWYWWSSFWSCCSGT